MAARPVELLDIRVLLWITWLDIFIPDAPFIGQVMDDAADVL